MSKRLLASLAAVLMMVSVSMGQKAPSKADATAADVLSLVYSPDTGNLSVDLGSAGAGALANLTTLEIRSAGGNFTGTKPPQLTGLFDVYNANKLFKLDPAGFGSIDLGPALAPGLGGDALLADLLVDGSFVGGGGVGAVPVALVHPDFMVPEPSSMVMVALGLLSVAGLRRRR
ncbi:MAG: PEP-CTERM sorting domain-containing protein [Pirellulaceae bacterium]